MFDKFVVMMTSGFIAIVIGLIGLIGGAYPSFIIASMVIGLGLIYKSVDVLEGETEEETEC